MKHFWFIILCVLCASVVHADETWYVNTGSTAGGDGTTKNASAKVSSLQETQWYAENLDSSATYYWRVVSKSVGGITYDDSEVRSFTTGGSAGPSAVTNLEPNDVTVRATTQTISWTAGAGCETYDVYFGDTRNLGAGDLVSDNQVGVTYIATGLTRGKTYYVRVIGSAGASASPPAETSFTVRDYITLVPQ